MAPPGRHIAPPPAPPPLPESKLILGWIDPKTSMWAIGIAAGTLALWAINVDARSREAERVNAVQERRLEEVEKAVKTLAIQTYQQEQMGKQLNDMSRQIDDLRKVPSALDMLAYRMGNVELAVGATPRRQQK